MPKNDCASGNQRFFARGLRGGILTTSLSTLARTAFKRRGELPRPDRGPGTGSRWLGRPGPSGGCGSARRSAAVRVRGNPGDVRVTAVGSDDEHAVQALEVTAQPTWMKSVASIVAACACRNCPQVARPPITLPRVNEPAFPPRLYRRARRWACCPPCWTMTASSTRPPRPATRRWPTPTTSQYCTGSGPRDHPGPRSSTTRTWLHAVLPPGYRAEPGHQARWLCRTLRAAELARLDPA